MFVALDQSDARDFFVVGSFWLPKENLQEFERRILELRTNMGYWREAHLEGLKKPEGRAYDFCKAVLEIAINPDLGAKFALVIAANKKDITKMYPGGKVRRDAVFMYELIAQRYRWWGIGTPAYVIFDDITHRERTEEDDSESEDTVANDEIKKARAFLALKVSPGIECFSPCRSHTSSAVQVSDLVAGLVRFRWCIKRGEYVTVKPNAARLALLEWFESSIEYKLDTQSLPSRNRFNIWKHNSLAETTAK